LQIGLGLARALLLRAVNQLFGELLVVVLHHKSLPQTLVPPTVMLSIRSVGSPTPTGTFCPSLPQVPNPGSGIGSLPTMLTFLSASGPTPISVAPLTGRPSRPFSISYASLTSKTKFPLLMSTCPPPN